MATAITNSHFKGDVDYVEAETLRYNINLLKIGASLPLITETYLRNMAKLVTGKEEVDKKFIS